MDSNNIIMAIRILLKAKLITARQAARLAVKYIDERGETTSAKNEDQPIICPTCRQMILPF